MVKDIQVGQKFLSGGIPGTIISVNIDSDAYRVAWLSDNGNHVYFFTNDGMFLTGNEDVRDLQPIPATIPATIEEGVEFCGSEYRAEFERLVAEGREFEWRLFGGQWAKDDSPGDFDGGVAYRLMPQYGDAVGNPLKVGDRVEDSRGR